MIKTVTHVGTESIPIPPPGWGAVEKWIIEVASKLNNRYRFKIISFPTKKRITIPNTEFVYLSDWCSVCQKIYSFEEHFIKRHLGVAPIRAYLNYRHLVSWSYARFLKKELKRHETDIYHFHQRPDFIYQCRPNKPVIIHLHNKIQNLVPKMPPFPGFFRGIDLADAVITVSKNMKDYFVKEGIKKDKIKVLYNGVDIKRYKPVKKAPGLRLLFVGKLVERKGVIHLMKAFGDIKKEIPEAELFIVGRKDEKSDYFKELQKYKGEGVTFTGVVSEGDLIKHYQNATMLVHPALYEAFGMTLVESMSCGTPVIGTNVGGIPEVLGDDGILVRPESSEDITKTVLKIARDRKGLERLSRNARKRVEDNFSWEEVSNRLSSIYKEF
jgi:glycosyltransferase involved in cell wall biosynthesis